jgi:hypothetical protein
MLIGAIDLLNLMLFVFTVTVNRVFIQPGIAIC